MRLGHDPNVSTAVRDRQNSDAFMYLTLFRAFALWTLLLSISMSPPVKADIGQRFGDVAQVLHSNPFKKPEISELQTLSPARPAVTESKHWQPQLKATLVGGARPAANVDGTIVYLGDKVQAYVLVDVRERSAVFEKEGIRRILKMDD